MAYVFVFGGRIADCRRLAWDRSLYVFMVQGTDSVVLSEDDGRSWRMKLFFDGQGETRRIVEVWEAWKVVSAFVSKNEKSESAREGNGITSHFTAAATLMEANGIMAPQ